MHASARAFLRIWAKKTRAVETLRGKWSTTQIFKSSNLQIFKSSIHPEKCETSGNHAAPQSPKVQVM
jgi:hypothetical protein